jgi:16S rRNA C967 or C1407 C5-methylase (RsmB/RsmF family)
MQKIAKGKKEVDGQGTLVPYQFDKILIDAPCSGEGTLRSSPKTYVMWNLNSVKSLSGMQKNLVASAIPLLKTGGEMVYSTCTHAPEENEEIVDFILKNFPEMKIEKISLPVKTREGITKWQDKNYLKDAKHSCRIYPHDNNTEGFFVAKFRKK